MDHPCDARLILDLSESGIESAWERFPCVLASLPPPIQTHSLGKYIQKVKQQNFLSYCKCSIPHSAQGISNMYMGIPNPISIPPILFFVFNAVFWIVYLQ